MTEPHTQTNSISNQVADGAVIMTGLMVVERLLSFISTLILARLLLPADFGIVAMCMSIVAALELFTAFGFDVVLIQNRAAEDSHYNTAWTLRLLFGVCISFVIIISASPTANFYDEQRVVLPMLVIAAGSFVRSFENIGTVDFRKNLDFKKEALFRITQKFVGFCVTIPLAIIVQNHWALVLGMVSLNLTAVALSYGMSARRPRFSLVRSAEIMRFSKWLLINNSVSFLQFRASVFLLGSRSGGAVQLGIFQLSRDISLALTQELVSSANRAIFPGYSKIAGDSENFGTMFLNVVALTVLFTLPIGVGLAFAAPSFVSTFFNESWAPAIPVIQLLALSGMGNAISSNCLYVFHASGQPKISTYISAFSLSILLPLLFYFIPRRGVEGAALSYLLMSIITLPVVYAITLRFIGVHFRKLAGQTIRPIVATLTMGGVLLVGQSELQSLDAPVQLLATVVLGASTYLLVLLALVRVFASQNSPELALINRFRQLGKQG